MICNSAIKQVNEKVVEARLKLGVKNQIKSCRMLRAYEGSNCLFSLLVS